MYVQRAAQSSKDRGPVHFMLIERPFEALVEGDLAERYCVARRKFLEGKLSGGAAEFEHLSSDLRSAIGKHENTPYVLPSAHRCKKNEMPVAAEISNCELGLLPINARLVW